ncbi:unnamed protein product [Caenorhabditis angaria]|uniref:Carboxylesterase type B domain-containing protein n=1 Tax=Caenorhabditis angaria TaxID=860376 RepID=A0A9P1ITD0_9PELO|nr:unnamed protein product [Caenorhabditis angaria]
MRNLLIFLIIFGSGDNLLINLSTGKIEGVRKTVNYSPLGSQNAVQFLGIPFAKPPIGKLRFRKPEKPGNWTGIRKADEFGAVCMSDPIATYKTTTQKPGSMSEDCLFLNVFTNDFCLKTKNCSLMLAIHGGRFDHETSSSLNPDILINNFVGQERNIVVVTTNYRLGIFGFGHFGNGNGTSEEASNFALWG